MFYHPPPPCVGDTVHNPQPPLSQVTLYDQNNFGGSSITYDGPRNIGCLVADRWNDRARSMRITQI